MGVQGRSSFFVSVFIELDRVELAIRTKLGHELGRLDPLIYLDPQRLNARARQRNKDRRSVHEVWLRKYQSALKASKEDFVAHHKSKYGGTLPIWAAVEIMDWGMLSYLYGMSPNIVRKRIAQPCDLTGPQLESWLKSLLAPPTGLVSSRPATEAVRHLPAQSHRAIFSHRRTRQLARVVSLARLILAVVVAFVAVGVEWEPCCPVGWGRHELAGVDDGFEFVLGQPHP